MPPTDTPAPAHLRRLMTPEGFFAMVALDQRESLREMFPHHADGSLVADSVLADFKSSAAEILSPSASGVLLDHPLGVRDASPPAFLAPGCGLVLAADDLHSTRGKGVHHSSLDPAVSRDLIQSTDAAAIKLLVIWRRDRRSQALVESFLELAAQASVATFVEGIVRPAEGTEWRSPEDRHDAIVEAAADLSVGASVYKAEVPGYVAGDVSAVTEHARRISAVVDVPWVVLSNGVAADEFADAVAASVRGGARGFLAGRAIWADTVSDPDPRVSLAARSVQKLQMLRELVARTLPSTGVLEGSIR